MDDKNQKKYFPALVDGEDFETFQKINTLPQKTQDILVSDKIVDFVYSVEQRFGLRDEQTEEFSRLVRGYFFREVTEGIFAQRVAEMCRTSPDEAMKLLTVINAITPGQKEKEEQMRDFITMSLEQAIAQYPQILQQQITTNQIVSKPFLQPLKPTVKNWIVVYEKILDVSKHDAIERGEFAYRADATRGLNNDDRQKLLMVLKSRDEGVDLVIDPEIGEIVFDNLENQEVSRDVIKQSTVNTNQNPNPSHQKQVQYEEETTPQHLPSKGGEVKKKTGVVDLREAQGDISEQMVDHEEDALKKATNELEGFMQIMQDRTVMQKKPQSQVRPQSVQEKVVQSELQKEIEKNRREMRGEVVEQKAQSIKKDVPQNNEKITTPPVTQKMQQKKQALNKTKRGKGKVNFSSNHMLPSEKSNKKPLQATKNFLNMKPIGQPHRVEQEDENILDSKSDVV